MMNLQRIQVGGAWPHWLGGYVSLYGTDEEPKRWNGFNVSIEVELVIRINLEYNKCSQKHVISDRPKVYIHTWKAKGEIELQEGFYYY